MRGIRSSPSMWATSTAMPSRLGDLANLVGASGRVRPPALLTTLIPRSMQVPSTASIWVRNVDAYPSSLLRARCLCRISIVNSANQSPVKHVDVAALDHLPGRRQPIAEEPAAVGDRTGRSASVTTASILTRAAVRSRPAGRRRRTPRPRAGCRGHDLVLHLHRLHRQQRLAGDHCVADADIDTQDRSGHRRDRRPGATGIVG